MFSEPQQAALALGRAITNENDEVLEHVSSEIIRIGRNAHTTYYDLLIQVARLVSTEEGEAPNHLIASRALSHLIKSTHTPEQQSGLHRNSIELIRTFKIECWNQLCIPDSHPGFSDGSIFPITLNLPEQLLAQIPLTPEQSPRQITSIARLLAYMTLAKEKEQLATCLSELETATTSPDTLESEQLFLDTVTSYLDTAQSGVSRNFWM